jgi:hypothetical protein
MLPRVSFVYNSTISPPFGLRACASIALSISAIANSCEIQLHPNRWRCRLNRAPRADMHSRIWIHDDRYLGNERDVEAVGKWAPLVSATEEQVFFGDIVYRDVFGKTQRSSWKHAVMPPDWGVVALAGSYTTGQT